MKREKRFNLVKCMDGSKRCSACRENIAASEEVVSDAGYQCLWKDTPFLYHVKCSTMQAVRCLKRQKVAL